MSLYTEITNFKIWSDILTYRVEVKLFLFIQHASYTSSFTDVDKEGIRFIEQYMFIGLTIEDLAGSVYFSVALNSRKMCKSCYYKCNNCHRMA